MIFIILGSVLGLVLGSLSLAVASRSLRQETFWGRSYCPHCRGNLRWYDLFPILSFLFLQGKCRFCHRKIAFEYPLVEILMATLIGYLFFLSSSFTLELAFKIFIIFTLVTLGITDLKKTLIPDRIVIPAIFIYLVGLAALISYKIWFLYFSLSRDIVGKYLLPPHSEYFERHAWAAAEPLIYGVVFSLLFALFFQVLIRLTKGKGMGGGDVKLGAFMGLTLGFPNGVLALFLAFLTGAATSLGLIILGRKKFKETIPFGPFLVTGSLVSLFWGNPILSWYLNLGS